jgi:F-type H+-transporting ATPase subunit b
MVLVSAWSIWAYAQQPRRTRPHPAPPTLVPSAGGSHPTRPQLPPVTSGRSFGRPQPPAPPAPSAEAKPEAKKEEAESEQPAPINWTEFGKENPPYIAMLINFGILVAAYYLLGKKPVAAALQGRRDTIAKEIDEAQRMRREAEVRAKTYQAKLEKLEEEMAMARTALVQAGEAERDRIVTEAEAKAERMRKDAEFLVEQELKQIRHDLLRDTVDAAVTAAEELLRKRVTQADHERLAEDYLADLGGKRGAGVEESVS